TGELSHPGLTPRGISHDDYRAIAAGLLSEPSVGDGSLLGFSSSTCMDPCSPSSPSFYGGGAGSGELFWPPASDAHHVMHGQHHHQHHPHHAAFASDEEIMMMMMLEEEAIALEASMNAAVELGSHGDSSFSAEDAVSAVVGDTSRGVTTGLVDDGYPLRRGSIDSVASLTSASSAFSSAEHGVEANYVCLGCRFRLDHQCQYTDVSAAVDHAMLAIAAVGHGETGDDVIAAGGATLSAEEEQLLAAVDVNHSLSHEHHQQEVVDGSWKDLIHDDPVEVGDGGSAADDLALISEAEQAMLLNGGAMMSEIEKLLMGLAPVDQSHELVMMQEAGLAPCHGVTKIEDPSSPRDGAVLGRGVGILSGGAVRMDSAVDVNIAGVGGFSDEGVQKSGVVGGEVVKRSVENGLGDQSAVVVRPGSVAGAFSFVCSMDDCRKEYASKTGYKYHLMNHHKMCKTKATAIVRLAEAANSGERVA
ncbi:hypothetical protein HDU76_009919, partial [Blyttiomyces sp. JEL0837]